MTVTDMSAFKNLKEFKLAVHNKAVCYDCDGTGYDEFIEDTCELCNGTGEIKLKYCRGCNKLKLPEQFYGQNKKQSRCIPCYKERYFGDYRRNLRARQAMDPELLKVGY